MKRIVLLIVVVAFIVCSLSAYEILGSIDGFHNMQSAYLNGDIAYLLDWHYLISVDISDPSSPVILDTLDFGEYPTEMTIDGDYAYVLYNQYLGAVDISDPRALALDGSYNIHNFGYDIVRDGDYFYIAALMNLTIIHRLSATDFEDVATISASGGQCKSVAKDGDFVFMGRAELGVAVYNVATPSAPVPYGVYNTPGWTNDLERQGDLLIVADGPIVGEVGVASMRVLDVSALPMISEVDSFRSMGGNALKLASIPGYLLMADGDGGIKIFAVHSASVSLVEDISALGSDYVANIDCDGVYIAAACRNTFYLLRSDVLTPVADTIPPVVSLIVPAAGSYSACPDQPVRFLITDDYAWDIDAVTIRINGVDYSGRSLTVFGDTVGFYPMIEWADGATINYSLTAAADTAGNSAEGLPISGTCTIDYAPPVVSGFVPASGETLYSASPTVQCDIVDDGSGVDPYSITFEVRIDDAIITYTYPSDISYDGTTASLPLSGISGMTYICIEVIAEDSPDYCAASVVDVGDWCFYVYPSALDTLPPSASPIEPLEGTVSSHIRQPMMFLLTDPSGVNPSSVMLGVMGLVYNITSPELLFVGDTLLFNPSSNWTEGAQTATLSSYADVWGNSGSPVSVHFAIDFTPPRVVWTSPASGDTGISATAAIQALIVDELAGLNTDTLVMTVDDVPISAVFSPSGDSGTTVTYVPSAPFAAGDTISVCLENIQDAVDYGAPNVASDYCFSFVIASSAVQEPRRAQPNNIGISAMPNPFNSSCAIAVNVGVGLRPAQNGQRAGLEPAITDIAIYDIKGNVVATLSPLTRGTDADRRQGVIWTPDKTIPSGIYLVRATIPQQTTSVVCTKRIVYLK